MKRIIRYLSPVVIAFFVLFHAGCNDKENTSPEVLPSGEDGADEIVPVDETTFFRDTLFYYGIDNTVTITCKGQGNTYEMEAFEGHVVSC